MLPMTTGPSLVATTSIPKPLLADEYLYLMRTPYQTLLLSVTQWLKWDSNLSGQIERSSTLGINYSGVPSTLHVAY